MDIIQIGNQFNAVSDKAYSQLHALFTKRLNKYNACYQWLVRCEVNAFFISIFDIIYFRLGQEARIRINKQLSNNALKNIQIAKKPMLCKIDLSAEQFISIRFNDYAKIIINTNISVGQFAYHALDDEEIKNILSTQIGRSMLALGDFIYFYSILRKRITLADIEHLILL